MNHDADDYALASGESEEQRLLRTIVAHVPAGILVMDGANLCAKWCNDAYLQFLDEPFRSKGIDGLCLPDFVPRAEEGGVGDVMRSVVASGKEYLVPEYEHVGFERGVTYWRYSVTAIPSGSDEPPDVMVIATDITEQVLARRHAETLAEQAEQAKAQLEAFIDNSPSYIYLKDREGRFLVVNQALADLAGMSESELLGLTSYDFLPEPTAKEHTANDKNVLETGQIVGTDEIVPSDEGARTFWTVKFPLRDSDGDIYAVGGISTEITDRKRIEEALRHSEERFRMLFSNMSEGFALHEVICDEAGAPVDYRFLEINEAFERLTGLRRDDVVGRAVSEIIPSNEPYWVEIYGKVALTGEPVRFENHAGAMDKWYEVYSFSPARGQFAVVFTDITGRKQAEKELARAHAEARRHAAEIESFVASMADGVVLYGPDANIMMANEAFKRLVGPPAGIEFEAWASRYEVRTLDGEPVPIEEWPSRQALKGKVTRDMRFRLVSPWRESVVSSSGSPVRDSQGNVIGGTVSIRDVSILVDLEQKREELLKRESHIAEVLQQAIIPPHVPQRIGPYSLGVMYQPALKEAQVGGDFYDIFDLGEDRVGILIGDVAGKGLEAALQVAAARYAIRSYAYVAPTPSEVVTLANRALCRDRRQEFAMLTAFFAVLDTRTGVLAYTGAGHEQPIVLDAQGIFEELSNGGVPLGIIPGEVYSERMRKFAPGDTMVMVTDGITEARTTGMVLFEKKGIMQYLSKNVNKSPQAIAFGLLEAATRHAGGQLQDDAAIVVLRLAIGDGNPYRGEEC